MTQSSSGAPLLPYCGISRSYSTCFDQSHQWFIGFLYHPSQIQGHFLWKSFPSPSLFIFVSFSTILYFNPSRDRSVFLVSAIYFTYLIMTISYKSSLRLSESLPSLVDCTRIKHTPSLYLN